MNKAKPLKRKVNEPLIRSEHNKPNLIFNNFIKRKITAQNNNKKIPSRNEQDFIKENIANKNRKLKIAFNYNSNKPKMIEENKTDDHSLNNRKLNVRNINRNNFNTYNNNENIKLNINIDIKVILPKQNTEKKEIVFNEEKIKEDLDINLNINDLLANNQNNDNICRNPNVERRIRRFNTFSNLGDIDKIPKKINFLFDDLNIFDAILLLLIYNSYINLYLYKNKAKLLRCEKNKRFSLSNILYYIYDYIWESKKEKIKSEKELKTTYQNFLDRYVKVKAKNCDKNFYLNNIDNLESITKFIYNSINKEITEINKDYKMANIHLDNKDLEDYVKEFYETHKSVISDDFTGFYQETTGNIIISTQQYDSFNYLYFDLSFAQNAEFSNRNINLYDCLKYKFNQQNQITPFNLINIFKPNTPKLKLYSVPKVLTIIINNKNGNFKLEDEINLSPYMHTPGNYKYYLIAMLCKYYYNDKIILYCLNPKDREWYYYTKGKSLNSEMERRVTYLDPNAFPYLLLYQMEDMMHCEYNKINLEKANNKKGYNFHFTNGNIVKLFFGINATVREVRKDIEKKFGLKEVKLIINAEPINDDVLLINANESNSQILVISK